MVAYKINSDVNMSNIQQNYFPMCLWVYPLERGKGYGTNWKKKHVKFSCS